MSTFQIILFSLGYFPFGQVCCYVISLMQPTSIYSGSYTLVAISIERYNVQHNIDVFLEFVSNKTYLDKFWNCNLQTNINTGCSNLGKSNYFLQGRIHSKLKKSCEFSQMGWGLFQNFDIFTTFFYFFCMF